MAQTKKSDALLQINPRRPRTERSEPPAELSETVLDWKSEIEALQSRHFSSIDEVIEALAAQVLSRFSPSGASDEEREFLLTLLNTDPEIKAELARAFQIVPE